VCQQRRTVRDHSGDDGNRKAKEEKGGGFVKEERLSQSDPWAVTVVARQQKRAQTAKGRAFWAEAALKSGQCRGPPSTQLGH
jgi:hypothetical protein